MRTCHLSRYDKAKLIELERQLAVGGPPPEDVVLVDGLLVNGADPLAPYRAMRRRLIAKQAHRSMESLLERPVKR